MSSSGDDPFAFIAMEACSIPPSQLGILQNSSFLNDDDTVATADDHHRPYPLTPPADYPILICSLPQTQPETQPAPDATAAEKSPVVEVDKGKRPATYSNQPLPKKSTASRRRSKGAVLVAYSNPEDGKIDHETGAPTVRMLPATLGEPKKEAKAKDSRIKSGSCSENPTAALKTSIKKEQEGASGKTAESKNPSSSPAPSNENPPPAPAPTNLLDAIRLLFPPMEADTKLGEMDILDICAMKGIHFGTPSWHRPGGYGRKPKDLK